MAPIIKIIFELGSRLLREITCTHGHLDISKFLNVGSPKKYKVSEFLGYWFFSGVQRMQLV